jgi:hypothetical protein
LVWKQIINIPAHNVGNIITCQQLKTNVKYQTFKVISDTVNLQIYAVICGKTITAQRTGTAILLTASVFSKTQIQ